MSHSLSFLCLLAETQPEDNLYLLYIFLITRIVKFEKEGTQLSGRVNSHSKLHTDLSSTSGNSWTAICHFSMLLTHQLCAYVGTLLSIAVAEKCHGIVEPSIVCRDGA